MNVYNSLQSHMIRTEVKVVNGGRKFFYSFIYGLNSIQEREALWRDLASFANTAEPWMIIGDFHSIMKMDERVG